MRFLTLAMVALALVSGSAAAQNLTDPAARMAAQRQAMARLAFMDGVWSGTVSNVSPAGRQEWTQTERVGLLLDGTVRVIESRGYAAGGAVVFRALGVVSYEPISSSYSLQSWVQSFGDLRSFTVRPDGYIWEVSAGPGAVFRYTATIRDGTWREIGERITANAPPVRFREINLRRVGNTDWPAAGAVPAR